MRFAICGLLVLCLIAMTLASPAKKQTSTDTCSRDCGDKYEPVCGKTKNAAKSRNITFGSDCVMSNYNCAHPNDTFEFSSNGECSGNASVLLS